MWWPPACQWGDEYVSGGLKSHLNPPQTQCWLTMTHQCCLTLTHQCWLTMTHQCWLTMTHQCSMPAWLTTAVAA